MDNREKFIKLYEELVELCNEEGWGDPFSYARAKEIHMACVLGHNMSSKYSGCDAYDKDGDPVEYKSTIGRTINATYNGISVFPDWDSQLKYLIENKIGAYNRHFVARYAQGRIEELYELSGRSVLELLIPKIYKSYHASKKRKDPRLGATLNRKEIYKEGKSIIQF